MRKQKGRWNQDWKRGTLVMSREEREVFTFRESPMAATPSSPMWLTVGDERMRKQKGRWNQDWKRAHRRG